MKQGKRAGTKRSTISSGKQEEPIVNKKILPIIVILALAALTWLGFIGGQKLNERFDAISRAGQVARGNSTNYELSQITLISATKVSETIWIVEFQGEFITTPPPGLQPHVYPFIVIRLNMINGNVISVSMHE
jgi:hypothetical protein